MKKELGVFTSLMFFAIQVMGQISADLSKNGTTETIDISLRPILIVKNMLPEKEDITYNFSIDMVEKQIPAISVSAISSLASAKCLNNDTTFAYKKALVEFNKSKNESEVAEKIKTLQKEIDKLPNLFKTCKEEGSLAIQSTIYTQELQFSLKNNQTITVTVKKTFLTDKGKDTTKTWTFIFKTPEKTPWHIMYGFTFVPNLMNPEKTYFCKADTSGKLFTITPLNNQKKDFWKNISPTIMIQWAPMTKYSFTKHAWRALFSNEFYQIGFVGGLSLNFASDASVVNIMAGPSFVIADNISLSGGVVFTQKNVLNGKFKEGDVIKQDLDFAMLHEKKYMFEWFLSMAIRFDTNPFAKKEEKK